MLTKEQQQDYYRNVICDRRGTTRYWGLHDLDIVTFREMLGDPEKGKVRTQFGNSLIGYGGIENIEWENRHGEISIIIAPEYRGSTGYGEAHHMAIDYGGYEIDDVLSAADYLKTLPHVNPERLGIMGWSHGGFISLHSVFRAKHPFKAAVAMVPVTNLFFRLSYKGPGYQRSFATQQRILGLPFEKREIYKERSPIYHVDKLQVPLLVHVATNDQDVNFEEAEQIIDALRSRKPALSETKVYVNPTPGPASVGHTFNRRTNTTTLQRDDSPEQIDSWNLVWAFWEKHLK